VSVTLPPGQNVVGPLAVTAGVATLSTGIVRESDVLQPFVSVTVTVSVTGLAVGM